MKTATPHADHFVNGKRFKTGAVPVLVILILFSAMVASAFSGGTSAREINIFDSPTAEATESTTWWRALNYGGAVVSSPPLSSSIVQIGFYPLNLPPNFTAGVANPATQPMFIQTQNVGGGGEAVTGSGQVVFIQMSSSSPTGRFDNNPSGAFSGSTLTLTVTQTRELSQNFFYRDPTPGTVVLTATVTSIGNTGLSFGETCTLTRSVLAVGGGKLSFGTPPTNTNRNAPIAPSVTVRVEDAAGNLNTTSTRNVSVALGSNPGGTLSGTTTVAAVGGIATFSNLRIDTAGNGYTLVASSALPTPALTAATSAPFNVNRLDQTIDFGKLENKTYGDADFDVHATSSSVSPVSFGSQTPDVCSIAASTVHIVSAGDCTIRATQAGDSQNNAAPDVDQTFSVNKAIATIVVTPYDVVYDGQPHSALVVSINGVNGEVDDAVGTVDLSGTTHANAGSYSADQWTFLGGQNYEDASGTVANNISRAIVTATAGGGSATFDGASKAPSVCVISGPGFVGDLTCVNDPGNVGPGAAIYSVSAAVNGTGMNNFDIAVVDGTYTIHKAPTVTTVAFEAGPYVYRGSAFIANARVTGPDGLDLPNVPVNYSGDCLNVTVPNGCVATAVYSESANHLESNGVASISIMKKPLTVAASSHNVFFGEPVPNVSPILSGFVFGETAAVIDVLPTCSTTYSMGSPVGTYLTSCADGSDNNYSFAMPYAAGTVIVSPACSAFNGFLSPVGGSNAYPNTSGPGGSFLNPLRTFKLNSTIPFKFTATCFGSPLVSGVQTLSAQKYSNGVPSGEEAIVYAVDSATTGNQFRYTNGQWQFNFKTNVLGDAAQGTWLFEATLVDGSKYNVWLAIRN